MRVLMSWLRELVDLPEDPALVARRLTMAGLEVEAIERLDEGLDEVVVGEVRSKEPIEGTKLNVCQVFDGETERQIVCGAANYSVGDHVPVALPGAVLPGGKAIGAAKLRGVDSFGMLCSGKEIGADDGVDGLLILERDTVPGTPIAQVLGRDDVALEINVTPNRADALSHRGVARELAALFGSRLHGPPGGAVLGEGIAAPASVEVRDTKAAPCYLGRVLENVRVGPSPKWLVQRLEALGQRSVNNVVDASNYVLFEQGQPTHAFDLDRLAGERVVVRRAQAGETLRTLDGRDRELHPDDLCICDADRPVGLAGVMGGEDSEVTQGTTRLLLESAWFDPATVRRTAKRHGIHSEASHRFERGVDPTNVRGALDRLTALLVELTGAKVVGDMLAAEFGPPEPPMVTLRHERLEALLGTSVPWEEALAILRRLGFEVRSDSGGVAEIAPPGSRLDVSLEEDLVEEVVRVRGFEAIPSRVRVSGAVEAEEPPRATLVRRLRGALSAAGFDEAVNLSFADPEQLAAVVPDVTPIRLRNPLASDQGAMRTTLVAGLLRNVSHNLRHGASSVRLYEMGRVYLPKKEASSGSEDAPGFTVADEPVRLALVAVGQRHRGWTSGRDPIDFYDLKGALETMLDGLGVRDVRFEAARTGWLHPRATAKVVVGDGTAGFVGELHPLVADAFELPRGVFAAELDEEVLFDAATLVARYAGLPRFPASLRDVAVVVDDAVQAARVAEEIRAGDEDGLLEEALLFDVYKGDPLPPGRKNLAFSLRYRAADRTLTDAEVNAAHARVVARLEEVFGARLRA